MYVQMSVNRFFMGRSACAQELQCPHTCGFAPSRLKVLSVWALGLSNIGAEIQKP